MCSVMKNGGIVWSKVCCYAFLWWVFMWKLKKVRMSAKVKDLFTLWLVHLGLLAVRDWDVRKVWYEKTEKKREGLWGKVFLLMAKICRFKTVSVKHRPPTAEIQVRPLEAKQFFQTVIQYYTNSHFDIQPVGSWKRFCRQYYIDLILRVFLVVYNFRYLYRFWENESSESWEGFANIILIANTANRPLLYFSLRGQSWLFTDSHVTTDSQVTTNIHVTNNSHVTTDSHITTDIHVTNDSHVTTYSHVTKC